MSNSKITDYETTGDNTARFTFGKYNEPLIAFGINPSTAAKISNCFDTNCNDVVSSQNAGF